ncbi:MAG TPA: sigma 54-interacting transcriptional regulator, partial [Polyangiaceae bacterium]
MSRVVDHESTLDARASNGAHSAEHHDLHMVFECDRPLSGSTRHCLDEVDEVLFAHDSERSFRRELVDGVRRLTIAVPDFRIGSVHGALKRFDRGWGLVHAASLRESASHSHPTPLLDGSTFELGRTFFLFRSFSWLTGSIEGPADATSSSFGETSLVSLSHEYDFLFARLLTASRAGQPILLIGEAGSGKDTLAQALHAESGRQGPFVAVNCAELGRADTSPAGEGPLAHLALQFKRAAGGTLYLNEIEGLNPIAQLALLPILRSGAQPCGATIISSVRSNHDLRPEVPRIRADLLAQLAGFTMPVRPLRERREDLGALLSSILAKVGGTESSRIAVDPSMGRSLLHHVWPYNLSELESCVRTSVALSENHAIRWSPATLFHASTPSVTFPAARSHATPPPSAPEPILQQPSLVPD